LTPPPIAILPATPTHTSSNTQECDYDLNPTVLYQAIEARQWEYAVSVFTKHEQGEQSLTWVVRKERNGKLRWRLLPLHAAVIFGSPLKLIELLLADYPPAAQSKDDQGMLPLHLAFRNEASWDVIEELMTAYPQAVYVSDRKGRTPLQCGMRSSSSNTTSSSASTASGIVTSSQARPPTSSATSPAVARTSSTVAANEYPIVSHKRAFRSVVNVLDLYSQIAVSGERKRAEQEARTLANSSITQLKDSHLKTLSALKSEWEKQQAESKRQMQQLQDQKTSLEERVQELEQQIARKTEAESTMLAKLKRIEKESNEANERLKASNPGMHRMQCSNQMLQDMNEDMIQQQSLYHHRVQGLLGRFKGVVAEREQIRAILTKSEQQESNELEMLEAFEQWSLEQGQRLTGHQQSLDEEKKVDDGSNLSLQR
jgi:hypothetical protein